jgi:DNA-binding response OmpR family regulator
MSTKNNHCPRILVVDDDATIRLLTAHALRKAGFEVVEACSADEGATHVCDANIDAIVTDVEMPGALNGYDLARRARSKCPAMTVFVVSGSKNSVRRALPPFGRFFEKPVDPGILIAELRDSLRKFQSRCRSPRFRQAGCFTCVRPRRAS